MSGTISIGQHLKSDTLAAFICPHCGGSWDTPIPAYLEPNFRLLEAAQLLGVTIQRLRNFLKTHLEIPRVYRQDTVKRRLRVLSAREIRYIRLTIQKVYRDGKLRAQLLDYTKADFPSIEWDKVDTRWGAARLMK